MKITLVIIALALLLASCEAGYVIYRAYWSNANSGVATCDGQADNVGIRIASASSSSTCADLSSSTTTTCTAGTGSLSTYKYLEVCRNVDSNWVDTLTSYVPPFSGTWLEVRTTAGTLSSCATSLLGSANTQRGWYKNGVCAFSQTHSSYMSRVMFNSTSAEARLNCGTSACETGCSTQGVSSSVVSADNLACGQPSAGTILMVRQVTGSASTVAIGAAALVAAVLLF